MDDNFTMDYQSKAVIANRKEKDRLRKASVRSDVLDDLAEMHIEQNRILIASLRFNEPDDLVRAKRRAMKIIEPELGYDAACSKYHLDYTSVRRGNFSKKFSTSINSASHRLHHLLPQLKSNRYSFRN